MIGRKALRAAVGAGIAGAVITVASPVSAHVGVDADEIEAGAATPLGFSFSHGCGDEPTTSLRFEIPAAVNRAVPQAHAGWDVEIETEALAEPVEGAHGSTITERPAIIAFTARDRGSSHSSPLMASSPPASSAPPPDPAPCGPVRTSA